MVEYGQKMEERMKAMQSEIKENVQGTNSEGKETRTQINGLGQKEEINIQPEQNEETRIQKNEERLRNFQDNFKCKWIKCSNQKTLSLLSADFSKESLQARRGWKEEFSRESQGSTSKITLSSKAII